MATTHVLATGKINKWGSSLRVAPHTPTVAQEFEAYLQQRMSMDDDIEDAATVASWDSGLGIDVDAELADLLEARDDADFHRSGAW